MDDAEVQVKFKAVIGDFLTNLKEATTKVQEATEGMTGGIGALSDTINKMGTAGLALAGVGLAFETLKKAAEFVPECMMETHELAESFKDLEYETGATTDQMNEYTDAILRSGGKVEDLQGLMTGMQRGIKANTDVLIANGVAANEAALKAMPFEEYLKRVSEIADRMATPTERAQFLILALGRSGLTAGPMLREFVENMKEVSGIQIIKSENMAQMEALEKAEGRLKAAQKALESQVSASATPMKIAYDNMKASAIEWQIKSRDAMDLYKRGLIELQGTQGKYAYSMTIDWDKMIAKAEEWHKAMRTALADMPREYMHAGVLIDLKDAPEKKKKAESAIPQYEEELNLLKARLAESQGDLATIGEEGERHFWVGKLAVLEQNKQKYTNDWTSIRLKIAEISKQMAKAEEDAGEQRVREEERQQKEVERWSTEYLKKRAEQVKEQAEAEASSQKNALDLQKQNLADAAQYGKITHQQELEALKQIVLQEEDIEIALLEQEKTAYKEGTREFLECQEKIIAAKRKANLDLNKLDHQLTAEQQRVWRTLGESINSSFKSSLASSIINAKSFSQSVKSIFGSVGDALIQQFVDMGVEEMATIAKTALLHREASQAKVAENAAEAGSAGMKSAAEIPIYGWAIAVGAGLAIYEAAKSLSSAAGGFDIPAGVNPLTQLHQREMVLPAELADKVRGMTGGSGGGDHYHFHGVTDASWWKHNQTNIARTLQEMKSNRRTT